MEVAEEEDEEKENEASGTGELSTRTEFLCLVLKRGASITGTRTSRGRSTTPNGAKGTKGTEGNVARSSCLRFP